MEKQNRFERLKFIHAADIHLDSPLRGLEKYDGAPADEIRGATRKALQNLVSLATSNAVDFVLIAGDIYDGDWKDYNTGLFFVKQMAILKDAGIRVFLIKGNHDAQSQISKELHLPDNVTVFDHRMAQSVAMDDLEVAIHGQSFASQSVTTELYANYPAPVDGYFNIGMLHTSATGREGHEAYAPCTVQGLISKGYDYWALGHIHKREVLCENPYILFPGNIQGRHAKETGPKGCTLVEVAPNHTMSAQHIDLDVVRWQHIQVDLSKSLDLDSALDIIGISIENEIIQAVDRLVCARITLRGDTQVHADLIVNPVEFVNQVRAAAMSKGDRIWIEKVKIETRSQIDVEQLSQRNDPIGELVRMIKEIKTDDKLCKIFADEFKDLKTKLPQELMRQDGMLKIGTEAMVRELLSDAQQILLPRLLAGETTG